MIAFDLHGIGIDDDQNHLCQDRKEWAEHCKQQIQIALQQGGDSIFIANQGPSELSNFFRFFRRQSNLTGHG